MILPTGLFRQLTEAWRSPMFRQTKPATGVEAIASTPALAPIHHEPAPPRAEPVPANPALLQAHHLLVEVLAALQLAAEQSGPAAERLASFALEANPLLKALGDACGKAIAGTELAATLFPALDHALSQRGSRATSLVEAGLTLAPDHSLSWNAADVADDALAACLDEAAHGAHALGAMLVELAARAMAEAEHPRNPAMLASIAQAARLVWADAELHSRQALFQEIASRLHAQHAQLEHDLHHSSADLE